MSAQVPSAGLKIPGFKCACLSCMRGLKLMSRFRQLSSTPTTYRLEVHMVWRVAALLRIKAPARLRSPQLPRPPARLQCPHLCSCFSSSHRLVRLPAMNRLCAQAFCNVCLDGHAAANHRLRFARCGGSAASSLAAASPSCSAAKPSSLLLPPRFFPLLPPVQQTPLRKAGTRPPCLVGVEGKLADQGSRAPTDQMIPSRGRNSTPAPGE